MAQLSQIAIENISRAIDSVAYALAFFKGFPPEDNMTLESAFRLIGSQIELALTCTMSPSAREWLSYSLREMATAQELATNEDFDSLGKSLSDVRDYLENAISEKDHSADYISSPDGQIRNTKEPDNF